jgi:hypothetical protein
MQYIFGAVTMTILSTILQLLTPATVAQIAQILGGQPGAVQKALTAAVPVILSGLLGAGATRKGADAFAEALGNFGNQPVEALFERAARDPSAVTGAGTDMLSSILGSGGTAALTSKLRSFAGLDDAVAGPLLGLAGATVMGGLGRAARADGLDAAGLLDRLAGEKAEIARAIPGDVAQALKGSGLLDAVSAPVAAAAPSVPVPGGSGMRRGLMLAAAALVVLWLLSTVFGGGSQTTAPAPEAPAEAALVVDGVDLGAGLQGALDGLTTTLGGITDAASAQAALPGLTGLRDQIAGLEAPAAALPEAGRSALAGIVAAALPAIRSTAEALLADAGLSGVLKPVLDDILGRLAALAG